LALADLLVEVVAGAAAAAAAGGQKEAGGEGERGEHLGHDGRFPFVVEVRAVTCAPAMPRRKCPEPRADRGNPRVQWNPEGGPGGSAEGQLAADQVAADARHRRAGAPRHRPVEVVA